MTIRKTIPVAIILVILCSVTLVYIYNGQIAEWARKVSVNKCGADKKHIHESLETSSSSILRKLAEYEKVCEGSVVDELMVFTSMPSTPGEVATLAAETAASLKEFAYHNTPPLVVFEPSLSSQTDLAAMRLGTYDEILKTYFQTLKNLGITDQEMGTWVLFPEANTPVWPTTDPADFAANVTKLSRLQKSIFPTSKVSIMLNSRTYQSHDKDWSHGEIKSLAPYISGIPADVVDRFGYQGFPSVSATNAQHHYSQLDAREFLPTDLAAEAAKKLSIDTVWINTGTFSRIHTGSPATEARVGSQQRRATLESILKQATDLKAQGFNVSVNLFAEDKSSVDEHIDWSYWQPGKSDASQDTKNFVWFVHKVRTERMGFSIYDDSSI